MTTRSSSSGFFGALVRTRTFRIVTPLVLLCLAGEAWNLHLNADPQVTIPPPAPLPSPNAYDELVRLAALKVEPRDDIWKPVSKIATGNPAAQAVVHTNTIADRQEALAKAKPVLDGIRAALATHAYREPARRKLGETDFQGAAGFRSLARTLMFESKMREKAGDYYGAANSAVDAVQLGVVMPTGGEMISRLVGYAVEAIGQVRLWGLVGRLDATQSAAIAQRLEKIEASRPAIANTLIEEKWSNTAQMRDLLAQDTTFGAYQKARKEWDTALEQDADNQTPEQRQVERKEMFRAWRELMTHSKQDILNDEMRMMDEIIAASQRPYTAPQSVISEPHDPINRYYFMGAEVDRTTIFDDAKTRTSNDFLIVAFALNAYYLQNGVYSDTLDQLKQAGLLLNIPDDPFAPKTGIPLHYSHTDATSFLLYSVGPDGVDNGGKPIDAAAREGSLRSFGHSLFPKDTGDWVYGVNTPKQPTPPVTLPLQPATPGQAALPQTGDAALHVQP